MESTSDELKDQWVAHPVTCFACMATARAGKSGHDPGRRYLVVRQVRDR